MRYESSPPVIAILVAVLLAYETAAAEDSPVSTPGQDCALARQLSWKNVGIDSIAYLQVGPEGEAAEALWRMGPRAAACLVSVLEDPERGPAAHLILTNIYHRDRIVPQSRFIKGKGDPKKGRVVQTVNGLSWSYEPWYTRYSVGSGELRQNALRWRRELKL